MIMGFRYRLSECGRQLNSTYSWGDCTWITFVLDSLEQVMLEGSKLSVVSGGGEGKGRIDRMGLLLTSAFKNHFWHILHWVINLVLSVHVVSFYEELTNMFLQLLFCALSWLIESNLGDLSSLVGSQGFGQL